MTIIVIGRPDSGKSKKAEAIACGISEPEQRYYIATMIPYGNEGQNRVKKHRLMREGKGFITVEQPVDVRQALNRIPEPEISTVLLECISNLAANEMFERHCPDVQALTDRIVEDVKWIQKNVKHLVIVSNRFEETEGTDEETVLYIRLMNELNDRLVQISDQCYML